MTSPAECAAVQVHIATLATINLPDVQYFQIAHEHSNDNHNSGVIQLKSLIYTQMAVKSSRKTYLYAMIMTEYLPLCKRAIDGCSLQPVVALFGRLQLGSTLCTHINDSFFNVLAKRNYLKRQAHQNVIRENVDEMTFVSVCKPVRVGNARTNTDTCNKP
jgi:hypothetical protein